VTPPGGAAAPPSPAGRRLPHGRAWSVGVRTVHLAGFSALVGGHVWGVEAERLLPALGLTLASGAALAGLELYQSLEWPFLAKGLVVIAKLGLLACVPFFWTARAPLLLAVLVLASVSAHMPARFRNYSVLARRVVTGAPPGG
jgi:hypothetical protein